MCRILSPIIWYARRCGGVNTKVKFKVTKRSKTTFLRSESRMDRVLTVQGYLPYLGHNFQNIALRTFPPTEEEESCDVTSRPPY